MYQSDIIVEGALTVHLKAKLTALYAKERKSKASLARIQAHIKEEEKKLEEECRRQASLEFTGKPDSTPEEIEAAKLRKKHSLLDNEVLASRSTLKKNYGYSDEEINKLKPLEWVKSGSSKKSYPMFKAKIK